MSQLYRVEASGVGIAARDFVCKIYTGPCTNFVHKPHDREGKFLFIKQVPVLYIDQK